MATDSVIVAVIGAGAEPDVGRVLRALRRCPTTARPALRRSPCPNPAPRSSRCAGPTSPRRNWCGPITQSAACPPTRSPHTRRASPTCFPGAHHRRDPRLPAKYRRLTVRPCPRRRRPRSRADARAQPARLIAARRSSSLAIEPLADDARRSAPRAPRRRRDRQGDVVGTPTRPRLRIACRAPPLPAAAGRAVSTRGGTCDVRQVAGRPGRRPFTNRYGLPVVAPPLARVGRVRTPAAAGALALDRRRCAVRRERDVRCQRDVRCGRRDRRRAPLHDGVGRQRRGCHRR
jgi:hypothetical protein